MHFFFFLFIPVANYIHCRWGNAIEDEELLIFKISQTFSDLGGRVGACLQEWGQLTGLLKAFF